MRTVLIAAFLLACVAQRLLAQDALNLERLEETQPRSVVFILSDDHRYDAMGFMGHPFLETPMMDRMAEEGVHLANAFVTTSLCSPSRASILTGQYAHQHRVINNQFPAPPDLVFFPQYLQSAGYETAFIGKWHMGGADDQPQPGFDHWVSFRGQGSYFPGPGRTYNINGASVPQNGYVTDELTDFAVDWLEARPADQPFFLYLSHKAVHGPFQPHERHAGRYANVTLTPPETQADTPENFASLPRWVKTQRNTTHGVEFPDQDFVPLEENYRDYCEALIAVDESIGRVLDALERKGILDSTVVMYMGDNGYQWGEHGLQDKRTAYEESMRVPFLMRCPDLFKAGSRVGGMVLNIDVAPTILSLAGLRPPNHIAGQSFVQLARDGDPSWRKHFLYEYYWERNYPQTPTMHALRGDRYKYVHYHGVYDVDELYDLQEDPHERNNLIASTDHQQIVADMNNTLFDTLEATDGMAIPLYRDRGRQNLLRRSDKSRPGDFPEWIYVQPPAQEAEDRQN